MRKVLVTGATGRTGSLVLKKLRQRNNKFQAVGFIRDLDKAREIFNDTESFFVGDQENVPTGIAFNLTWCKASRLIRLISLLKMMS